jgi:hypothetical protein
MNEMTVSQTERESDEKAHDSAPRRLPQPYDLAAVFSVLERFGGKRDS